MRSATKQRKLEKDSSSLVTIGAKVDPSFHSEVKEFAFRNNMSIAYLLETAIKEYIERYEKD